MVVRFDILSVVMDVKTQLENVAKTKKEKQNKTKNKNNNLSSEIQA